VHFRFWILETGILFKSKENLIHNRKRLETVFSVLMSDFICFKTGCFSQLIFYCTFIACLYIIIF